MLTCDTAGVRQHLQHVRGHGPAPHRRPQDPGGEAVQEDRHQRRRGADRERVHQGLLRRQGDDGPAQQTLRLHDRGNEINQIYYSILFSVISLQSSVMCT